MTQEDAEAILGPEGNPVGLASHSAPGKTRD